jgi:hypothetical protein
MNDPAVADAEAAVQGDLRRRRIFRRVPMAGLDPAIFRSRNEMAGSSPATGCYCKYRFACDARFSC